MIKSVVFDIGGVLIDFSPEKVLMAKGVTGGDLNKVLKATTGSAHWKELDRGVIDKDEVIARMKEGQGDLGKWIDWFFDEGIKDVVSEREYAVPWIKGLKERGLGVYLLSNYPVWAFEMHKARFGFLPLTNGRVVSAYEKVIKPDRAIYELLLSRYGLKAEECVFVDDVEINVRAACELGIHGVQFASYKETFQAVDSIIDEGELNKWQVLSGAQ